jgi:ribonucleoside-triphosphate reductase
MIIKKIPCLVFSRVVGYYQPVSQWNIGKKEEFKERREYEVNIKLKEIFKNDKNT